MIHHVTLKVEGIAGSSIEEAAEGLCALARRLDIWVFLSFNGELMFANPDTTPADVVAKFSRMHKKGPPDAS